RFGAACRSAPELAGMVHNLFERLLPQAAPEEAGKKQLLHDLLERHGFDRVQHESIQADLRSGRIGLAQNRLPVSATIEDVRPADVLGVDERFSKLGMEALRAGEVA